MHAKNYIKSGTLQLHFYAFFILFIFMVTSCSPIFRTSLPNNLPLLFCEIATLTRSMTVGIPSFLTPPLSLEFLLSLQATACIFHSLYFRAAHSYVLSAKVALNQRSYRQLRPLPYWLLLLVGFVYIFSAQYLFKQVCTVLSVNLSTFGTVRFCIFFVFHTIPLQEAAALGVFCFHHTDLL